MPDSTETHHGVTGDDRLVAEAVHHDVGRVTIDILTDRSGLSAIRVNQSLNRLIAAGLVQALDGEGCSDMTAYSCCGS